jgi:glutamate-ammonia-ligase adenylyltransferase
MKGVLADPMEATKFYSRIVRGLVALMQDRTANGYVFRTDLRLRPDPGSTPVAISFDAAIAYYEVRGQNWERAAWTRRAPALAISRPAKASSRKWRPMSGASISISRPSPISRR